MNIQISGKEDGGHWAIFNAIPTAAHTIWGALAGQILMSSRAWKRKLGIIIIAGVAALIGSCIYPFTRGLLTWAGSW